MPINFRYMHFGLSLFLIRECNIYSCCNETIYNLIEYNLTKQSK